MIRRLLIVNRGEIALRIVRAARELGVVSIVAHSEADADTLAVRQADEAVCIGPAQAAKSYLNIPAVLDAARNCQADAVHPGYGFLSESADFARAVQEAGLIFVGPDADIIARMGDKASARQTAMAAGVPVVPGSPTAVESLDQAKTVAEDVGYPLLIKAAAGGGGRGIRVAEDSGMLAQQLPQAQAEAQAAFGDGRVYLERFITQARHIEVQVLGDGQRAVHFFERECSLQRRRQKIFEEAPSPALDEPTRQRLCESAVALAEHVGYRGAGTLEYLFDDQTGEFFFIEMNTRIQVEHPVTEMVTGIDLINEQIRVAAGLPMSFTQSDLEINGHAIEVRINAERLPNFAPCPGKVRVFHAPGGLGVRMDSALYGGYSIPPYYDSLIGKLIVHGRTRVECMMRLRRVLDEFVIDGIKTTLPLFQDLINNQDIANGDYDIHWLEKHLAATSE